MLLNGRRKRETRMTLEASATTLINRRQCGHTYRSERAEDFAERRSTRTPTTTTRTGPAFARARGPEGGLLGGDAEGGRAGRQGCTTGQTGLPSQDESMTRNHTWDDGRCTGEHGRLFGTEAAAWKRRETRREDRARRAKCRRMKREKKCREEIEREKTSQDWNGCNLWRGLSGDSLIIPW